METTENKTGSKMKSDEWGTPDSIYNLLPRGSYFDPCPFKGQPIDFNKRNGEVVIWRDGRSYPEVDGLKTNWGSQSFVNPPFSDIEPWIQKAQDSWIKQQYKSILVIPNHTDRKWFRRSVQPYNHPVIWFGRIKFIPLDGQHVSQPQFGTGLLMIGYEVHDIAMMISAATPFSKSAA